MFSRLLAVILCFVSISCGSLYKVSEPMKRPEFIDPQNRTEAKHVLDLKQCEHYSINAYGRLEYDDNYVAACMIERGYQLKDNGFAFSTRP